MQQAPDLGERRRLMFEIAETCAGPMREPRLGFDWFRRAYAEHPDDEALVAATKTVDVERVQREDIVRERGVGHRDVEAVLHALTKQGVFVGEVRVQGLPRDFRARA